jgi:hypothetical protein
MLAAQTPLTVPRCHPGWERSRSCPWWSRASRLVGVLTRDALTRAVRRVSRRRGRRGRHLAEMLARGYWDALSGGAEAMATLLPTVAPVAGGR